MSLRRKTIRRNIINKNKRSRTFRSHTLANKKLCPSLPYIPSNNNKINAGNNFYKYINSKWLRGANIEPFQSSTGVSQEMQDIIDKTLFKMEKLSLSMSEYNTDKRIYAFKDTNQKLKKWKIKKLKS